jgi:L-alanine-DL-glutamate epimerase-like enolase superfamily enzyme
MGKAVDKPVYDLLGGQVNEQATKLHLSISAQMDQDASSILSRILRPAPNQPH